MLRRDLGAHENRTTSDGAAGPQARRKPVKGSAPPSLARDVQAQRA